MSARLPRLMLVTDRRRARAGALRASLHAGAPFVQFRDKDLDEADIVTAMYCISNYPTASQARPAAGDEPLLCVNGRPALARRLGVGLHLPADHAPVDPSGIRLLGRSVHDAAEVDRAKREGVDYVILGTLFASASKPGRTPLGLAAFARLVRQAEPIPVFAIGGITTDRVADVMASGAHGVAVTGAILQAADPAAATQAFMEVLRT